MGEIHFFGPGANVNEEYLRRIRAGDSAKYYGLDFDWFSFETKSDPQHIKMVAVMTKDVTADELVKSFRQTMYLTDDNPTWLTVETTYDRPLGCPSGKSIYRMISLGKVRPVKSAKKLHCPDFTAHPYRKPIMVSPEELAGQAARKYFEMYLTVLPDDMGMGWESRAIGMGFNRVSAGALADRDRTSGGLYREVWKLILEEKLDFTGRGISTDYRSYQAFFLLPQSYLMAERKIDYWGQQEYWNQFPNLETMLIPEKFIPLK